ncbi:hypothetical protein [Stackebrandtia nassauensis]|uniref:Uncharacterized protein n=1 Tax=Stackebrandtia nassauensis (strain DSM 44728 / CIP 108903 / NRRL B-16338 / NBRC 102104 / LLR-40K-21) TaxID=446470 RepID=D3PWM4_STANL|nr:hypothetical protein [Stackebrandtia nassauensis]ADD43246.1 hypothetical protein Snas_3585 [Stackebrandtia nassauensis DSM 44728]
MNDATTHSVSVIVSRDHHRWAAEAPSISMWTFGRTLSQIHQHVTDAAALALDIHPEHVAVTLTVVSPELEELTRARAREQAALTAAVRRLRSQKVSWPETARILHVSQHEARAAVATASVEDNQR